MTTKYYICAEQNGIIDPMTFQYDIAHILSRPLKASHHPIIQLHSSFNMVIAEKVITATVVSFIIGLFRKSFAY